MNTHTHSGITSETRMNTALDLHETGLERRAFGGFGTKTLGRILAERLSNFHSNPLISAEVIVSRIRVIHLPKSTSKGLEPYLLS